MDLPGGLLVLVVGVALEYKRHACPGSYNKFIDVALIFYYGCRSLIVYVVLVLDCRIASQS